MPVFPELRLLFIHIPKNAGRSVEQALLGARGSPSSGRRTVLNRVAHALQQLTRSRFAETHLIGTLDQVFAAQHLTLSEIQLLGLSPETVGEHAYRSFCVCRNPFDRVISSVFHFGGIGKDSQASNAATFERALDVWLDRPLRDHNERAHRRLQIEYILDARGRLSVDEVLRYENLEVGFAELMRKSGRESVVLPWHGKSFRSRKYDEYFTPASRKKIEMTFGEDIEAFKYRF